MNLKITGKCLLRMTNCLALVTLAGAVTSGSAQSAASDASAKWRDIVVLVTPPRAIDPIAANKAKSPSQSTQDFANQAKQIAIAAKDFYAKFPSDQNAGKAKKTEALYAAIGAQPGDSDQGRAALQTASAYRSDSTNSAKDRLEVAVAMEQAQLRLKPSRDKTIYNSVAMTKAADNLQKEFGNIPEVGDFYIGVARTADRATSVRMAQNVLAWNATPSAKTEAQAIIDRNSLIGTKLNLKLTTVDGSAFDLGKQSGKVTVVFVWSVAGGVNSVGSLSSVKKGLPNNAQIVYLGVGGTAGQATIPSSRLPVPGILCFETKVAAALDLLKIRHLPYVFVLD